MVSRKLMAVWAAVDICLMAAGIVCIVMSTLWRAPNVLLNMVFSKADLTAGLVLGIMFLATFVFSIGAIVQANHVIIGLIMLNWTLVGDAIAILCIGTFLWFYTLGEENNFHQIFSQLSAADRIFVQDKFSCCGYFNSTDLAEVGGTFCQNTTFIQVTNNATGNFCVVPITNFADYSLHNVFTTIYGFMAVVIVFFLATLCVIQMRNEDERFKKIDAKRGGKGFV